MHGRACPDCDVGWEGVEDGGSNAWAQRRMHGLEEGCVGMVKAEARSWEVDDMDGGGELPRYTES